VTRNTQNIRQEKNGDRALDYLYNHLQSSREFSL